MEEDSNKDFQNQCNQLLEEARSLESQLLQLSEVESLADSINHLRPVNPELASQFEKLQEGLIQTSWIAAKGSKNSSLTDSVEGHESKILPFIEKHLAAASIHVDKLDDVRDSRSMLGGTTVSPAAKRPTLQIETDTSKIALPSAPIYFVSEYHPFRSLVQGMYRTANDLPSNFNFPKTTLQVFHSS